MICCVRPRNSSTGCVGRGKRTAAREGKCWDPVEKEMNLPKQASWPNYEEALPFVLRRYYGLWGRST